MKKSLYGFTIFVLSGMLVVSGCGKSQETKSTAGMKQEMSQKVADPVPAGAPASMPSSPKEFKGFKIYSDDNSPDNHFFPSGWMGDYSDLRMDTAHLNNPHSGTTCIKVTYNNKASQGARWAGVYWQNPANNWGNRAGGYDLTGAKKLTFWARGEKGGERLEEIKVGGITGQFPDSDVAGIGPLKLTTEWKKFEIDLEAKDLTSISGGFCWAANLDNNPDGIVFYLDDIRYE